MQRRQTPAPPRARCLAILLAAAALILFQPRWTLAQGTPTPARVLVDKSHNALVTRQRVIKTPQGGGTATAGVDLHGGLSTIKVDVDLTKQTEPGSTLNLYSTAGDQGALVVGNFKIPLPPKSVVTVNGDGKIQLTNDVGHVDANLSLTVPTPADRKPPFTNLSLTGSGSSDYNKFQGKADFSLGMTGVQDQVKGIHQVRVTLSEAPPAKGATGILTTVGLQAEVDAKSPLAGFIQQVSANPKTFADALKQKLAMLQVDSVDITQAEVKGDTGTFAMTMKARGLRDALKMLAGMGLSRLPAADMSALRDSVDSVLALQFNKLEITANIVKDTASGSLVVDGKNLDKFMEGYLQIMASVQEAALKQQEARLQGKKSEAFAMKWASAVQRNMTELNLKEYQALVSSGVQVNQTFGLTVQPAAQQTQIQLDLKSDTTNIDKAMVSLKAAGFPVLSKAGALFQVKTEGGQVTGSIYANGAGANPLGLVKMILIAPAQKDPDLKPTADMLAALQLKDSALSGQLVNQKLELTGYADTSDLTAAAKALQGQVAPDVVGVPDGARLDVSTVNGTTTSHSRIHFTGFMPGKSAADVKSAVAPVLGPDVQVQLNAPAAQVALTPALTKPSVAMSAELAAIKVQDEATLFATSAVPGMAGGLSRKGTVIAIIAGALVLIAIALAASRRKPA